MSNKKKETDDVNTFINNHPLHGIIEYSPDPLQQRSQWQREHTEITENTDPTVNIPIMHSLKV